MGTSKAKPYRSCVSMLILRPSENGSHHEVLLVHKPRKNDAWQLPQGGVEKRETLLGAASRELREETGILASPQAFQKTRFSYQYDYPIGFVRSQKPPYGGQKLTITLLYVPHHTKIKVDKRELDSFRWIRPNQLKKYLKRVAYRRVVEQTIRSTINQDSKKKL